MKTGLWTAIAVGAASGALIGLLFAPDKGAKTREKFLKKAKDLAGNAKDQFTDGVNELKGKAKEAKSQGEQMFGKGYNPSPTMGS